MNILNLSPEEFADILAEKGQKPYRAKQILKWIYEKRVFEFEDMTTIAKSFRASLKEEFEIDLPKIVHKQESADKSVKFLLELADSQKIEMVVIPQNSKNTLCVSSQVGCSRGCKFCATATMGLIRNLNVAEILGQVLLATKYLQKKSSKLTNIVFMGMGEPLDNYDSLIKSIRIIQHEEALKFSPRRITISTCGIIPQITKLADSGLKFKLAVSLGSAINSKRTSLMPVNKIYPLDNLKAALKEFRRKTPFRITFEYTLIKGVNTFDEDFAALKRFTDDLSCKLNIIGWNPVDSDLKSEQNQKISEMEMETINHKLQQLSCAVTVRSSRGSDVNAACGQLCINN